MTKILVVDNYDSFVFNLVQYLQQLGAEVVVKRNDEVNAESINGFDGVLLSPGPGTPEDAGACIEIVNAAIEKHKPLLGVCLGHQAIGAALGGKVSRAPELLHGKTSQVKHNNEGVFKDLKSPFTATRYHSLAIETASVPDELVITATTSSNGCLPNTRRIILHSSIVISSLIILISFLCYIWEQVPNRVSL